MTREEAISVLEESKRQNEIMRDNPNTFFKVSDIVTGEKNAQKRIDALDMAISALRQQEHFREVTKKVEPLTPDEMRDMPCEPVYIVAGYVSWWDIVSYAGMEYLYLKVEGSLPFRDYGKNWTAYRQKQEEGTD